MHSLKRNVQVSQSMDAKHADASSTLAIFWRSFTSAVTASIEIRTPLKSISKKTLLLYFPKREVKINKIEALESFKFLIRVNNPLSYTLFYLFVVLTCSAAERILTWVWCRLNSARVTNERTSHRLSYFLPLIFHVWQSSRHRLHMLYPGCSRVGIDWLIEGALEFFLNTRWISMNTNIKKF